MCSSKRKSQCRSPCTWVTGKGCRSPENKRKKRKSDVRKKSVERSRVCPPDKILNPETNRCVSRDGKIGRRILEQQNRKKRRDAPKEVPNPISVPPYPFIEPHTNLNPLIQRKYGSRVLKIISEITRASPNQITFIKHLGKGSYGDVYIVKIIDRVLILKFEQFGGDSRKTLEELVHEYKTHEQFYLRKTGVPKPFFYGHVDNLFITAMKLDPFAVDFGLFEKQIQKALPTHILKYMLQSIDAILAHFKKHKLMHGDFHWGNIGFQDLHSQSKTVLIEFAIMANDRSWYYISPLVIDFGFAHIGKSFLDVELIQLIRTLYPSYIRVDRKNREFLYQGLLDLVDKYAGTLKREFFPAKPQWTREEENLMDKMFSDMRRFAGY